MPARLTQNQDHGENTRGVSYPPTTAEPTAPGFMCKKCGDPSPAGIGYADARPGAHAASATLTACPCGWSVAPPDEPPHARF